MKDINKYLDVISKNMKISFAIIQEHDGEIHFMWDLVKLSGKICSVGYLVSDISKEYCEKLLVDLSKEESAIRFDLYQTDTYIADRWSCEPNLDFKRMCDRNGKLDFVADNNGWYGFKGGK